MGKIIAQPDFRLDSAKFARSEIRALRYANLTPREFQLARISSNFFISCWRIYLNYVNSDNLKQIVEENN